MTERLHSDFSLSCIGEGNGNALQCSCLENPRHGGAWWAAVYGVAQSRTQLKRLSSSSSSSSKDVTVAHQPPLSVGFPRHEHWNELPFPSPGESSQPRDWTCISCLSGRFFTTEPSGKPKDMRILVSNALCQLWSLFIFYFSSMMAEKW